MDERQKSQSAFLIYPGISQKKNPNPKCTHIYIYICYVCVIMEPVRPKKTKSSNSVLQLGCGTDNTNFSGQIFSEEEENIV